MRGAPGFGQPCRGGLTQAVEDKPLKYGVGGDQC